MKHYFKICEVALLFGVAIGFNGCNSNVEYSEFGGTEMLPYFKYPSGLVLWNGSLRGEDLWHCWFSSIDGNFIVDSYGGSISTLVPFDDLNCLNYFTSSGDFSIYTERSGCEIVMTARQVQNGSRKIFEKRVNYDGVSRRLRISYDLGNGNVEEYELWTDLIRNSWRPFSMDASEYAGELAP